MGECEHLLNVVFQIQQCLGTSAQFGTDSVRVTKNCNSLLSQIPSRERQTMRATGTAYIPSRPIQLGRTEPNPPELNRAGALTSRRTGGDRSLFVSELRSPIPDRSAIGQELRFPFATSRYYGQNFSPLSLRLLVT